MVATRRSRPAPAEGASDTESESASASASEASPVPSRKPAPRRKLHATELETVPEQSAPEHGLEESAPKKDAFSAGDEVIRIGDAALTASTSHRDRSATHSMALDSGYADSDLYFTTISSRKKSAAPQLSVKAAAAPLSGRCALPSSKASEVRDADKATGVAPLDSRRARMEEQKQISASAGKGWFNMCSTPVTDEVERDLRLLQNRGVLDPKRHYKSLDWKGRPKVFQVGKVVSGAADFFSGRLSKQKSKETLADELLEDDRLRSYAKRKHVAIQQANMTKKGKKGFFKKKKKR